MTRDIVVCQKCNGEGGYLRRTYHDSVAQTWIQCPGCADLDVKTIALKAIVDADSLKEAQEIARKTLGQIT